MGLAVHPHMELGLVDGLAGKRFLSFPRGLVPSYNFSNFYDFAFLFAFSNNDGYP